MGSNKYSLHQIVVVLTQESSLRVKKIDSFLPVMLALIRHSVKQISDTALDSPSTKFSILSRSVS
jgi:hypothetical protein